MRKFALLFLVVLASPCPAQSNGQAVALDRNEFRSRLGQVSEALQDFRTLSELLKKGAVPGTDLNRYRVRDGGDTYVFTVSRSDLSRLTERAALDRDVHTIGYPNWIDLLEIHEQALALENARLRSELAAARKRPQAEIDALARIASREQKKMDALLARENAKIE